MAEIKSALMTKGRRSFGNITMRMRGGHVIISDKVWENKSNTPKQKRVRNSLTWSSKISKSLEDIIKKGYVKDSMRSERNLFMKKNVEMTRYMRENLLYDDSLPAITNLCMLMYDPDFKEKIYCATGDKQLNSAFEWGTDHELTGNLKYQRDFMVGDILCVGLAYSYKDDDFYYDMVRVFEKELTQSDLDKMPRPNHFVLNKDTFPGIDIFEDLPPEAAEIELLVTAVVQHEQERSTSILYVMPDAPYEFAVASQTTTDGQTMKVTDVNPALFREHLHGKCEGSELYFIREEGDVSLAFPFKDYATGDDGEPNGLLFGTPPSFLYMVPFEGMDSAGAYLSLNDVTLAVFDKLKEPLNVG